MKLELSTSGKRRYHLRFFLHWRKKWFTNTKDHAANV